MSTEKRYLINSFASSVSENEVLQYPASPSQRSICVPLMPFNNDLNIVLRSKNTDGEDGYETPATMHEEGTTLDKSCFIDAYIIVLHPLCFSEDADLLDIENMLERISKPFFIIVPHAEENYKLDQSDFKDQPSISTEWLESKISSFRSLCTNWERYFKGCYCVSLYDIGTDARSSKKDAGLVAALGKLTTAFLEGKNGSCQTDSNVWQNYYPGKRFLEAHGYVPSPGQIEVLSGLNISDSNNPCAIRITEYDEETCSFVPYKIVNEPFGLRLAEFRKVCMKGLDEFAFIDNSGMRVTEEKDTTLQHVIIDKEMGPYEVRIAKLSAKEEIFKNIHVVVYDKENQENKENKTYIPLFTLSNVRTRLELNRFNSILLNRLRDLTGNSLTDFSLTVLGKDLKPINPKPEEPLIHLVQPMQTLGDAKMLVEMNKKMQITVSPNKVTMELLSGQGVEYIVDENEFDDSSPESTSDDDKDGDEDGDEDDDKDEDVDEDGDKDEDEDEDMDED